MPVLYHGLVIHPPSCAIISRNFFSPHRALLCLAQYAIFIGRFRSYANRASAQNMGIFWICVKNLFVLKIHFGLSVLFLVNITVICIGAHLALRQGCETQKLLILLNIIKIRVA